MAKNLVSIITPSHNAENYISSTINSVLKQTHKLWEHIIIDDCSEDKTRDIVQKFCEKDNRIKLISLKENKGPALARNFGIESANGKYIAFLDSDDIWYPEKLEKQINFMKYNNCLLSYSDYEMIHHDSEKRIGIIYSPPELSYENFKMSNELGSLTAMYDSEKLGKIYMPNTRNREDWALWWEITKRGFVAKNVGDILAKYRVRPGSRSQNRFNTVIYTWRFYKNVAGFPFYERAYRILLHSLIKYRKHRSATFTDRADFPH